MSQTADPISSDDIDHFRELERERLERERLEWRIKAFDRPVPRDLLEMTIGKFQPRLEIKNALEVVNQYLENLQERIATGYAISFLGHVGLGKTALATVIGREILRREIAKDVFFVMTPDLLESLKPGDLAAVNRDNICTAEVAILDDLGREYQTAWSMATLDEIISIRHTRRLPTFLTSNFFLADMRKIYDPRIVDRLTERNDTVELRGRSYRQMGNTEKEGRGND